MQKFWNWCSHCQEIYDWISSFDKRSGLSFILRQKSMGGGEGGGGNEYGKSDAFEVQISQGFIFAPYQLKTLNDSMYRAMQLRSF